MITLLIPILRDKNKKNTFYLRHKYNFEYSKTNLNEKKTAVEINDIHNNLLS